MTQKEDFEGRGFFTRLRAVKLFVATFPEIRYCREIVRVIAEGSVVERRRALRRRCFVSLAVWGARTVRAFRAARVREVD